MLKTYPSLLLIASLRKAVITMPQRDGKGPPWSSGPGTGRRFNQGISIKEHTSLDAKKESKSIIAVISSAVALLGSLIELFSSKKQTDKKETNDKITTKQEGD